MREIKFRAWDKEQKQMIYGGYVVFGMPLLTDITDLHQTKLGKFPRRDSVLMQFTGLYDKNGKEIYEGDIVEMLSDKGLDHGTHVNKHFQVYWFGENGAWYLSRKYREEENMEPLKECHEMLVNCDFEIVGNIYEHAHLLNTPSDCSSCAEDHEPEDCPMKKI